MLGSFKSDLIYVDLAGWLILPQSELLLAGEEKM